MSTFTQTLLDRAKSDKQTIVLAEGSDPRTLQAARTILDEGIANLIILGNHDDIVASGISDVEATIIDPATSSKHEQYAQTLARLREKKGMTIEQARELIDDVLYYGALAVYEGDADGMVAGACHSTGDVLRPCLQTLKTAPGTKIVSSFFMMVVPECDFGDGIFLFADCGLNQNPNADELSEIALSSAQSYRALTENEPTIAMLSYSTYGSAHSELVDKVVEATKLAHEKAPELNLDGELQFDAAVVPAVGASKAPGSKVAGKANVLVFPDLNSGNITYKAVQRFAKAEALGPITQGMAKPVNDLSRGCSAQDIVGVVAITCVQAQCQKNNR